MTTTATVRPIAGVDAKDGQIGYVEVLLAERNWAEATPATYAMRAGEIAAAIQIVRNPELAAKAGATAPFDGGKLNQVLHFANSKPLTIKGASALIDWLKTVERKAAPARTAHTRPATALPEVPAGRYAVATDKGAINEIAFYVVDRPETGKWAGYTFVKRLESDTEVRLGRAQAATVLAKIAADPAAASKLYGHEIGACGVCGRTLTNDASREAGIGPKCQAKAGW
ncbi:hypothetical protein SEA_REDWATTLEHOG_178 [Gordonia phage RedWattleHog]|uniref:Uncharacterized protein n=1 Tax=Gordonia phage Stormageddon TaxID=2656541 RepID=A0A649VSW3_9CAUD|nr:hypothetical protein KHQ86_gp121 [Gordonia phage Stormageddon]QGJ95039.1 hypothetical protein SEA_STORMAGEDDON_179 [Gordonia phage Stormageddon]QLF83681.1 hypothetical protein SEA_REDWATTLEHOG_178 [Gordonia phage RedWattleHog]